MRLRDRRKRAKRVFAPLRVFRLQPWMRRPRARWRWAVRAGLRQPPEPYEFQCAAYVHLSGLGIARLGSVSTQ